jgi:hypothetical protein
MYDTMVNALTIPINRQRFVPTATRYAPLFLIDAPLC